MVETIKINSPKEKQNWRKRKRIELFVMDNLEGMWERDANKVRKYLYEN